MTMANPPVLPTGPPNLNPLMLTYVSLAVGKSGLITSPPAATKTAAFTNIWSLFSTSGTGPANVTDWSGNDLQYYPTNFDGCAVSAFMLVTSYAGEGQCGSFMFLLASALSLDGISYNLTGAKRKTGRGC